MGGTYRLGSEFPDIVYSVQIREVEQEKGDIKINSKMKLDSKYLTQERNDCIKKHMDVFNQ